jgi:hypothetical protein
MNWKEYENIVFEALSIHHMHDLLKQDFHIIGKYSKRSRQIDIYIQQNINNIEFITIIDCKNYNKKINVKTVESFISMVEDVGADYGIIISELGFTKSALLRAVNNPRGIDLDIYDFKDITHHLQGESAFPNAGDNMVFVIAPFGWIVDAKKSEIPVLCLLYKKGLTFEEAINSGEFGYIDFWDIRKKNYSIKELSDFQVNNIRQDQQIESIEYQASINSLCKESMIRIVRIEKYHFIEITGFICFDNFIFFCVFNSTELYLKRNIRKMHILLKQTLPLNVRRN